MPSSYPSVVDMMGQSGRFDDALRQIKVGHAVLAVHADMEEVAGIVHG
jgi:hypothetical protein